VVGHTKCGGVEAAWLASREPSVPADTPLQRWLLPLIALSKELHLDKYPLADKDKALRILTEENARRQVSVIIPRGRWCDSTDIPMEVFHLSKLRTVQDAWNRGQRVYLHAWVFQMETGLLVDVSGPFPIEKSEC
jgi:carbonic anhydrase